ncbi:hypothetical protein CLF_104471 [Clonorchis sinensis]|uniref:Uncharacterized protein n=1 Tax=Clonorchis sinensis TaxID=79923 RepID=G7YBR6_CLOSI|nr:hypothetical protein CLF_104471 [Clonorchis sinensis]
MKISPKTVYFFDNLLKENTESVAPKQDCADTTQQQLAQNPKQDRMTEGVCPMGTVRSKPLITRSTRMMALKKFKNFGRDLMDSRPGQLSATSAQPVRTSKGTAPILRLPNDAENTVRKAEETYLTSGEIDQLRVKRLNSCWKRRDNRYTRRSKCCMLNQKELTVFCKQPITGERGRLTAFGRGCSEGMAKQDNVTLTMWSENGGKVGLQPADIFKVTVEVPIQCVRTPSPVKKNHTKKIPSKM